MKHLKLYFFSCLVFIASQLYSQVSSNCATPTPFCTGQTMNFPASTNAGSAPAGPNYGCLGSQPNPAWFFMQIANTGSMSIAMAATNDIDFICWGPFSSLAGSCNSLTASNIQSCSYSGSPTETCTISNAIAGQFYLLLITNFSNSTQNITFNQSNAGNAGAATTNCGFVCVVTPTISGHVCVGQSVTLSLAAGTSTSINSYTWSGPGSFSSTQATNVINNVTSNSTYSVVASNSAMINGVPYSGTCQAAVTVSVTQYPTFSLSPSSASVCQGSFLNASVIFTPASNPANYFYSWAPAGGSGSGANTVLLAPPMLAPTVSVATVIYTVNVAPLSAYVTCAVTKTLGVTIYNPSPPVIASHVPLCNSFAPVQLSATPGGGTWSANPAVGPAGTFSPALASIGTSSVTYATSVHTCVVSSSKTISVSKYHTPALTTSLSTVCVQDAPINLMNIVQNTVTGSWKGTQVSGNLFNPSGLPTGGYTFTYSTVSLPNPTVCPDSTTLLVQVFNPPIPVIAPIAPVCTNAATVVLTASPSINGLWSGNQAISSTGIQTPSLGISGTNTVTYSSGQGTCVASSSRTFHVSQFVSATLTGTVPHLCFSSNPFNLLAITQNSTGIWSGYNINGSNFFNPSGLPTGIYTLTYQTVSVPNATLCQDIETIDVSVLNPVIPNIVQVGPFCNTSPAIQLSVSPATGSWVASSYVSPGGMFTPSLSPIGSNIVQYVIGTPTCLAQQTKTVSVEAFESAAITSSIGDLCTTSVPLNLSFYTLSNSGTWSGPGIQGSNFNPASSGAGNFTITYQTASSPSGLCPDNATVAVQVYSLAAPAITKAGPFCNTSPPVQLQVSPVGGLFGSGLSGLVTPSGVFNPALGNFGDNVINYSISVGPCVANVQARISVEKFVSASFGANVATAYCKNAQAFNLDALVQNPGGVWSGSGVVGLSMFDPSKASLGENNLVYQTHSYPTTLLCPDQNTISIKVKDRPAVNAWSIADGVCAPVTVAFTSTSSSSGLYSWNLGDGGGTHNTVGFTHVFNTPGTYTVVFNYDDNEALGCSTQVVLAQPIVVHETPRADFRVEQEEITIANPEVKLTNLSSDIRSNYYQWTIKGLNQVSEINPSITLPGIGKYEIHLQASSLYGCKDEVTKIVEVKNDFHVFIPNSFTPNYDGTNDVFIPVFSPYGLDRESFSMEIYDRWGHEVFRTNDVSKGWDGNSRNTSDLESKEDSYVYKIKYKDLDGKLYSRSGYVVLLK